MIAPTDWFVSWFDSPYYHTLYQHRNDQEAQVFMNNLTTFLALKKGAEIIDIPCGKGRHALYLSTLGYKVTGLDLSVNSILSAQKFEHKNLKFEVHDMRLPFSKKYAAVFNLFTSFGYFDTEEADLKVLDNFKNGLKTNGFAVIDFINIENAMANLVVDEIKIIDGIRFFINKKIENGFIVKSIEIEDNGEKYHFFEKVKCIDFDTIKNYLNTVGFQIKYTFGNYNLETFDLNNSDRLILVVQ